jgi:hypothetical protein
MSGSIALLRFDPALSLSCSRFGDALLPLFASADRLLFHPRSVGGFGSLSHKSPRRCTPLLTST